MDNGMGVAGAPPRSQGPDRVESLRRTLSFYDLVIYGIAYVCPFGIFQSLGFVWQASNGLIVLAYILATICMYFTAKSYAVMTEAVPSAGSIYGYARHALGPFAGFIGGWMILLDYLLIPAFVYVFMQSPWARWCRRWIERCGSWCWARRLLAST